MTRSPRTLVIVLGVFLVVMLIPILVLPMFLNTDSFRTKIESTLSNSLGRKVTMEKLELSIWSGGMVAQNAVVADDPRFSNQPFIQAASVKIGVEIFPLLMHRELHVRSFTLNTPKIQLLRASNGTWNYSTIGNGAGKPEAQNAEAKQTFPDLTVGEVEVSNGQITVGAGPGATGANNLPLRTYQQVNLDVKRFSFASSFPFTASAQLPADGNVSVQGTAGPINQQDAAATPFSGHLEMKHIDPLAAGFVDASDGISGQVEDLILDAAWTGQQMQVKKLLVTNPHLTLTKSNTVKPAKPVNKNAEGSSMLENLAVDDAEIRNGTVTITNAGQAGPPAVYQQLNAKLTNLSPKTASPFTVSAQLPGGGSLNASGQAGPFNQENSAATPLDAKVNLQHVELANAGVLPADAGISGLADLQAQVKSNGQTLNANGTAMVANIKLAKDGQPSAKPVQAQFVLTQNEQAMTGQVQQGTITVGKAVIQLAGTYQTSGPTTALNLKVNGNGVPINEIEAFLPAVGVHLPQGSRLNGGTVTTDLTVSGSTASPTISGPVRVENTQLAGFDLGSKLKVLSQVTGGRIGSATGSGTTIRSLSMNIVQSGGGIRTDKVALDVAGVGTATGAGTVSAGGALNYNMVLKLTGLTGGGAAPAAQNGGTGAAGLAGLAGGLLGGAGGGAIGGLSGAALRNGIPVAIGGTTSNPTFAPNMAGVISSVGANAAKGLLNGKTGANNGKQANPLQQGLGGLFRPH